MQMDAQLIKDYERETCSPFADSLTGLFNHAFFQISLGREVLRSERDGLPFTLALIDIDSFARYNKQHGAIKGDRLLKEIAGLILKNIRKVDLAARYSGDVFTLILTESETQSALVAVERIREAIQKMRDGASTISVGLASYPGDDTNAEGLIKKAEEALLGAKIRGKNRVHFFEKSASLEADYRPRVLVVDDEPQNVKLLEALLRSSNYEVIKSFDGEDALSIVKRFDLDLVLTDIMMPVMDGYELCRRLKGREATRLIPVVMLTSLEDIEDKVKGIEAGADDFLTKPPNKVELLTRIKSLIRVKSLNDNLTTIENVLFSLANAVEAKDAYTQGHTERVANLALALGTKMGLTGEEIKALRLGGILHDIGKIGVSREILNKPGPLDPEEFEIMKTHAEAGYKICLPLKDSLGGALDVIRHHHEKLDGSGYPDGLKGGEMSIAARVMAVVDIYDALITDRPYRKALSKEKAFAILSEEARGGKLDGQIVEYLAGMVSR